MGLVAGALEQAGIPTVCLSVLEAVMERVRPPRRLVVNAPLGFPMGPPHDTRTQRDILSSALHLLRRSGHGPVVEESSTGSNRVW